MKLRNGYLDVFGLESGALGGIFLLLLGLSGCVPNRIYRSREAAVQNPALILNPGSGPATIPDVALGFVEFDDMGEFWESCSSLSAGTECQLSRVLALIRAKKQEQCGGIENCRREVVVIVFVHGWKNNASRDNEEHKTLYAFKDLLAQLATRERNVAAREGRPARTYIGIYMAWRGQALAGDLFATFWNRRDTAGRIAGPSFSEAVFRIISASKEDSPNNKVVIVGHSFGSRLLENSISDTFVSLVLPNPKLGSSANATNIISPADLVVYVNSANDSFHAKEMIELLKRSSVTIGRTPGNPVGPLFLSVTSVGDLATKIAFPVGQNLSTLTKSFREYDQPAAGQRIPSQRDFFTHTAGHLPYLFSHEVTQNSSTEPECKSAGDVVRFFTAGHCYELRPKSVRWNDSPYWVTTVPSAIIPDHNQIFTTPFVQMLTEVIEHYEVVDSRQPTRMLMQ